MIDFSLTDEQIALRSLVREFCETEVRPVVAELDARADQEQCFPWELFKKAHELGLRTLPMLRKYGGREIDLLTEAILIEEAGACDAGFAMGLHQIWMVTQTLQRCGNKAQLDKYLPLIRDDPFFFLSAALCEPEAGSDCYLPSSDPGLGIRLTATVDGDEVILNGTKAIIAMSPVAKLILVYARTDASQPMRNGTTMFLVTPDSPGFRIGRVHDSMGWRLFPTAELIFDGCRIPKANQVTAWNKAYSELSPTAAIHAGAMAVGMARSAYDKAVQYASTRVQGGKPIIEHANTSMQLAEMLMQIESARYLTWKVCWAAMNREHWDPRLSKAPKVLASRMARNAAIQALEIHGGRGVMREAGMEKIVRDVLTLLPVFGPNDVCTLQMGQQLRQSGS